MNERRNKLKKQKRKARFLAILTLLALFGSTIKDFKNDNPMDTITNIFEYKHIKIVDQNGIIYPTKLNNFKNSIDKVFSMHSIPLYNSYEYDKEVIDVICEYQPIYRTFDNGEFSYVTTEDGKTGYVPSTFLNKLPDTYVELDISEQKLIIMYNNELVLECYVVTGKDGRSTNIGYTEIIVKQYNRTLSGVGYSRDVKYAFLFNDDEEFFHDASWRSEFGGDIYKKNGSLGCVNMREEDIEKMDKYVGVGTKVLIHK